MCVDRFVTQGTNSKFKISGLIYGEVSDFIFISLKNIYRIFYDRMNDYQTGVHVSSLSIEPQTRNLNSNPKYESRRYCVQVK